MSHVDKGEFKEKQATGLKINRLFTKSNFNPLDAIEYEKRKSCITEPDGTVVFEFDQVEVPKDWSQLATDIIASKYFRKAGVPGTGHEVSAKQVVHRIANTIRAEGEKAGYFGSKEDADAFEAELGYMMITQRGAFNSPVWFNVGLFHQYGITNGGGNFYFDENTQTIQETKNSYEHPQCSACFIQSVEDDLMKMFDVLKTEARLFKYGSGTGTNFSKIRGRQEKLSGGGTSSGLMSFLEVFDRAAGATKSGGTTRRAAKMVCLDIDHPEIIDFINWKVKEEKKVQALIVSGYASDFNGEAYKTVSGQNSNNSVRVSDEFMTAVIEDKVWHTTLRTSGKICDTYQGRDLMNQISYAAWACADPGLQYDSTINNWHTCPNTDRIYASNPCSEYMFLNNTACNLSSCNLMKFIDNEGNFLIEEYRHACRIFTIAKEIIVGFASYPTAEIAKNSIDYRTLGLGYANLGTLLMVNGIPYDSDQGRAIAATITSIMCGEAYATSAEIAGIKGPFPGYANNALPMMKVIEKHRYHAHKIDSAKCPQSLLYAAQEVWDRAIELGTKYGFRNAQVTVLAPTGTIGLLMDCDTTGVEPDFALVKWKKLAGGGYFKIINKSVTKALSKLQYNESQIKDIITYMLGHETLEGAPYMDLERLKKLGYSTEEIEEAFQHVAQNKVWNDWTPHINSKELIGRGLNKEQTQEIAKYVEGAQTIEGSPHINNNHIPVFDCANKCGSGVKFIAPMGHVRMMAAVQPFISGAISKTVNLPHSATVEEIKDIYLQGWKLGLKAVALYRDGCKLSQPLNVSDSSKDDTNTYTTESVKSKDSKTEILWGTAKKLPQKRHGITISAKVGPTKVHLRTGEYEDGALGEVFIDTFKEGASYRGLLNCFAVAVSIGLQHGVPLKDYVDAFTFTRFEPSGMTNHPNVKTCTSIIDYVFRVIGMEYLNRTDFVHVKPEKTEAQLKEEHKLKEAVQQAMITEQTVTAEASHIPNTADTFFANMMGDAPACDQCGHITVRNGACYKCTNCGNSMGCS
ncbi:ribonucleoside-diphosphate reductase, adenosylcobalamin-dependent [Candidatus Peregrinibacteria bacterium RIFOXYA12_FULL_33_12]|nr:MAG: ribonucleoside-diphosphate reductase, adenosylcobalamin-dependent [Candidatus Peregrinibacteria bacterium RIFOXYA12_FULL_33_12]OGJ44488.1 MAG: ribonucleoside-diphosphate reductase, adenosylcobalamin-dependent [Candidatus Peregrinibacteria bacterium RIFOXYA2_FULL_33_21]OGJ50238.1 MAG: ribonucleoside-diphosphate reductase, adenosylcobalamin-dependent [Candidatus Peregrinibacteria bacterium RIFOXYB2_FULL_33_20]